MSHLGKELWLQQGNLWALVPGMDY